jgi:hypothetical protein
VCVCVCVCLCIRGLRLAQLHLDEVLEGRPGLEAFDVAATKVEAVAISFLRRYRSAAYYDAPADADSLENQQALRAAAEGEEPRPHSAA